MIVGEIHHYKFETQVYSARLIKTPCMRKSFIHEHFALAQLTRHGMQLPSKHQSLYAQITATLRLNMRCYSFQRITVHVEILGFLNHSEFNLLSIQP